VYTHLLPTSHSRTKRAEDAFFGALTANGRPDAE
jgi:hypothetical protein